MLTTFEGRSLNVNGATPSGPIDPNDDLVHFCHVAALVVTLYDHLITLDKEVEYIWSQRRSKSKILYLLARYFGDILLISVCVVFLNRDASFLPISAAPSVGTIGLKFVGTGSMITIIITQLIMQSRVKALYGPLVSTLLTIFWVMEVIAVVSLGVASLAAIDVHPVILHTTRMCNPTYLPRYAFLFWVPVIVFESVLFALALRIAYQNYREIGTWRGASLLYVILRDNFSFFVCAFAAYIVTATTWLTANPRYFTVPGSFSCSLTTIMGCRLIFNLCEAYHHPPDPDESRLRRCRDGQGQGRGRGRQGSIWAVATSGDVFFRRPDSTVDTSEGEGEGEMRTQTRTRRTRTWARGGESGSGVVSSVRSAMASVGTFAGKTTRSVGLLSSGSEVTEAEAELVEAELGEVELGEVEVAQAEAQTVEGPGDVREDSATYEMRRRGGDVEEGLGKSDLLALVEGVSPASGT